MIVLMMSPSRCSTMWIVGLTIRRLPLRPLRPLRPIWRLPAPPIGLSVPSALPLSVGGFFLIPSLPPPRFPVGGGSRRSFGCAAPLGRPVWAGVVAVFGGLLGGVLGGCCGLCWLCCSSSFGLGWSLFCSGRLRCALGSHRVGWRGGRGRRAACWLLCAVSAVLAVPSLSSGDGSGFSVLGWGCRRSGVPGVGERECRNGVPFLEYWVSVSLRHLGQTWFLPMSEHSRSNYGVVFWVSWVGVGDESAEKFRAALAGGC